MHISAVQRSGLKTLNDGQFVSFEIVKDRRTGKEAADKIGALEDNAFGLISSGGAEWQPGQTYRVSFSEMAFQATASAIERAAALPTVFSYVDRIGKPPVLGRITHVDASEISAHVSFQIQLHSNKPIMSENRWREVRRTIDSHSPAEGPLVGWWIKEGSIARLLVADVVEATKRLEPLQQGVGPHFAISEGILSFAKVAERDDQGNHKSRLDSLHPLLLSTTAELIASLAKGEGLWSRAETAARAYYDEIDEPIEQLDMNLVYGRGLILQSAIVAASGEGAGNAYPLGAEQSAIAKSLLSLHGPFILATATGQALLADAERFDMSTVEARNKRALEIEFARILAEADSPVAPEVKLHVADVLALDDDADIPSERRWSYQHGLVRNAAMVLVGGTVVSTIAAFAIVSPLPTAAVGFVAAVVGKEGIKNSELGKEFSKQLTSLVNQATVDFALKHEERIRELARGRPHMAWLINTMDWCKEVSQKKDEPSPPRT